MLEVCDGNHDCFSNEDEEDCPPSINFQCRLKNEIIPYQYFCDYNYDCTDLSDEIYCSKYNKYSYRI